MRATYRVGLLADPLTQLTLVGTQLTHNRMLSLFANPFT